MNRPQPLKFGDKIALCCPASRCLQADHPQRLQQFFADKGFATVVDPACFRYVSAGERAQSLLSYLQDDSIAMLWAVRGGEGSADLLPYLRNNHFAPKWLMGFSDITALLNYFALQQQWSSVHGMCAAQFLDERVDAKTQALTWQLLKTGQPSGLHDLQPLNVLAQQNQVIKASGCCGGTLSLLTISIGDCWHVDTRDKIIIIEDVNEPIHVVRRHLFYLSRIGFFNKAKAVIFGEFSHADLQGEALQAYQQNMQNYLGYFAEQCPCAVFKSNQFGHGKKNYPVMFNVACKIDNNKLDFNHV